MNVCVIGTGYVGLVTGACFAEFGCQVICADVDAGKIEALRQGQMPIYEPGLEDLVVRNVQQGRLAFTTDTADAVRASLIVFIAVPTPPREDGSTDLTAVEEVAREIGRAMDGYKVIVNKSTVPVGSAEKVRRWIEAELPRGGRQRRFSVASNPEFLREGAAIGDFMRPDRVVIGADDEEATAILKGLYRPLYLIETPVVVTSVASAELTKYAANAFLATKVSFINEIANLCEAVGADVHDIARAIGLDRRIGGKFLHPGPGFGGSCFPKDTRSVAHFARAQDSPLRIVEAVIDVNEAQMRRMVEKISALLDGDLSGREIGALGLSFKPETDDMRDAPSLSILRAMIERGARVRAYDPQAMANARKLLPEVVLCENAYDVCEGADVLVVLTEWNQFRMLDLARVKSLLRQPLVADLRNIYDPVTMRDAGFSYVCVGR
ncbi:MAG TPA: UDP-glucose/GDP-mannose dehydrogenase family protein [Myxococcota bacterium]|nr:UDP-glucose/GDP-mannose dehydrogenase family protein [Myxococcota bacterium]